MTTPRPRCRQPRGHDRDIWDRGIWDRHTRGRSRALCSLCWIVLCLAGACSSVDRCFGAEPATTLVDLAVSDLAAPANGQVVYAIDERQRTIVAFEPHATVRQRLAVAAAPESGPRPVAVACIDTTTLVAVCVAGESWSLRSWRLKPDAPADPAQPLQTLGLGSAPVSTGDVHVAVNGSRTWLAVIGLPEPLPPVLRGPIAGNRVGKCSDRGCPRLDAAERPVALAITAADELVLVCRPGPEAQERLSFHDLAGRRLLHLDLELPAVHDMAFNRGDGTLLAVGGTPDSPTHPEGVWRLDAAIRDGRQVVSAVRIAECPSPRAVLCPTEKTIVVASGQGGGRVLRFQPAPPEGTQEKP